MSNKRNVFYPGKHEQQQKIEMSSGSQDTFRIHESNLRVALQRLEINYAQLERTQGQLRAIIDATPDAMLFLTPDGRPVKMNKRFTDYFELDDVTVLSQTPEQLIQLLKSLFEPSQAITQSPIWNTADSEQVYQESLVQAGPLRREFDCSSLPVINFDQTHLGRLYMWHDTTQEREVDRMKSTFTSMVTHELRSPLTCIDGYLEVLLEEPSLDILSEEQREYLRVIRSESRRMLNLTNDLLDLSYLESGTAEKHKEQFDLHGLIKEVIPTFRNLWETKQQTFSMHLPAHIPLVTGDPHQVKQILINLLSNAHKYTPEEGSIELTIMTIENFALIAVTDSGVGMSNEEQAQLFTKFYRAKNPLTREVSGTGLGLTIVKTLVELQGGEIQVSSTPGKGSTFSFTLAFAQENM